MRPLLSVIVAIAVCAATTTTLLAQKQLQILATVSDPGGAEVTSIDPKDVKVTENGTDLTVVSVEQVQRTPKLQVLIDNGIGMPSSSVSDLRRALKEFINTLPPSLEVTLVTTAPQPRFLERATTDRVKLLSAVDRISPDTGTGRYTESLAEAADRADKDKDENAAYTLLSVATMAGDTDVRDGDVKRLYDKVGKRHITVHTILLTSTSTTSGGQAQTDIGESLGKGTGGSFETINVPSRLVTLLPEVGKKMAGSLGPGAKQFRVVVSRPGGGAVGPVGFGVSGRNVTNVSLEAK